MQSSGNKMKNLKSKIESKLKNNQISKLTQSAKTAQVRQKNFHEEIQDFSELDITNHFMFFKIFTTYSAACKRLLEILLGTKIAKIDYPLGEKDFEADIDSHAIRVDVYTEDDNHVYDIEMQTTLDDDLPERSRYYQALMDIDKLKHGEPYKNLKDSIVIFICKFDPFGKKKPKYEFKNLDIADGKTQLGDRTTKIFFNVNEYDKIKEDGELKSLLKYFSSKKSESSFTNTLNELVKQAQHNTQWRQTYMTKERFEYYARQQGIREGIAQGITQGFAQGIQQQKAEDERLLKNKDALLNSKDAENAMQALKIKKLQEEIAMLRAKKK